VLGAVIVARDMTEQKRTEKELIEAKVFAELATGIAEQAKNKAENGHPNCGRCSESKTTIPI
jgi:hypothetical protein